MEDASFRRAPITPDRVSPAREGQAAQRIDHDGFVKSICVSLERKIAEATKEQHTAQLAQSQKVAKTNELAGLRTDLRHERAENMVLREKLCEICLQLDELANAKEAGEQEHCMTEQELQRSRRMLRNTWESQNARAATLQDAAFELEQELGTMRVQYAAAVASLQVIDHERLALTSRNAVMQRDLADLIHKHSQLHAYCERLKQKDANLQSNYHAALQSQPHEQLSQENDPSEGPKIVNVEDDLQSPQGSPGPKGRPGAPARLDSLREKLLTSIGALVSGLNRSNSSLAKVHHPDSRPEAPEGALQGNLSGHEQKRTRSPFKKTPRSPFIKARFSRKGDSTTPQPAEDSSMQDSPKKSIVPARAASILDSTSYGTDTESVTDLGSHNSSPRRDRQSLQPQLSGSPLGHRARRMANKLVLLGRSPSKPAPVAGSIACDPPSYDLADAIAEPDRYASPTKARMQT
ncbi:hypothetical protein WJX74_004505 [Apatococcus lobatus]|uniref:Uncharacterized protein n=1 Tax=Apatococcus lobatus TaxID=904363 RepID=A0AAW1SEK4_9CHLO